MNTSVAQKVFIGAAVLLAALSVAVGVSDFLAVIPAILIAAGLGINLRSRLLGGGLVLIGAAALAVIMWWTVLVPILAGLTALSWRTTLSSNRDRRETQPG